MTEEISQIPVASSPRRFAFILLFLCFNFVFNSIYFKISKKGVVDDIFLANPVLYPITKIGSSPSPYSPLSRVPISDTNQIEHPDHCIVLKKILFSLFYLLFI
jgi:hypothetical protein